MARYGLKAWRRGSLRDFVTYMQGQFESVSEDLLSSIDGIEDYDYDEVFDFIDEDYVDRLRMVFVSLMDEIIERLVDVKFRDAVDSLNDRVADGRYEELVRACRAFRDEDLDDIENVLDVNFKWA